MNVVVAVRMFIPPASEYASHKSLIKNLHTIIVFIRKHEGIFRLYAMRCQGAIAGIIRSQKVKNGAGTSWMETLQVFLLAKAWPTKSIRTSLDATEYARKDWTLGIIWLMEGYGWIACTVVINPHPAVERKIHSVRIRNWILHEWHLAKVEIRYVGPDPLSHASTACLPSVPFPLHTFTFWNGTIIMSTREYDDDDDDDIVAKYDYRCYGIHTHIHTSTIYAVPCSLPGIYGANKVMSTILILFSGCRRSECRKVFKQTCERHQQMSNNVY